MRLKVVPVGGELLDISPFLGIPWSKGAQHPQKSPDPSIQSDFIGSFLNGIRLGKGGEY